MLTDLETVDLRHHDVQQHEVRQGLERGVERGLTVIRGKHLEAFEAQVDFDETNDVLIVVRDEDELRLALDRLDPEILLLFARRADAEEDALERVLALLPDVPAGKLAIADVEIATVEAVAELERAGVDAVIVRAGAVAGLAAAPPPSV